MDELFRLLQILQQTKGQPPRAHEFLQELRDISSMAMEHFEENIVPGFKQKVPPGVLHFGQQYANSHSGFSNFILLYDRECSSMVPYSSRGDELSEEHSVPDVKPKVPPGQHSGFYRFILFNVT